MPAGPARQRMNTAQAPTRFAAQRLSREEIVAAAIAAADRDGVDAVSMRRVAAALGSGTMSLYRHVASREQLLDLMIDSAYSGIELPARPSGAWRQRLLALLAHAQRRMMHAHPWAALLVGSRPPVLAGFLRPLEAALAALTSTTWRTPTRRARRRPSTRSSPASRCTSTQRRKHAAAPG